MKMKMKKKKMKILEKSAPKYLFNDIKFIQIDALVEKWQAKQKLMHKLDLLVIDCK